MFIMKIRICTFAQRSMNYWYMDIWFDLPKLFAPVHAVNIFPYFLYFKFRISHASCMLSNG